MYCFALLLCFCKVVQELPCKMLPTSTPVSAALTSHLTVSLGLKVGVDVQAPKIPHLIQGRLDFYIECWIHEYEPVTMVAVVSSHVKASSHVHEQGKPNF